jgi:CRP-like cAMP-binding protein
MVLSRHLNAGDTFGEMSLLDNQPRMATIVCTNECHFAVLDKKDFVTILKEHE